MTNRPWARETTYRVGQEARRLRGDRTVQWLSDRTDELGHRVGRSRLSDLERGDRGGVLDVAELVVLAKALEVPPLQLLLPIGHETMTEVLPGTAVPTWLAAKWFTGESAFPVPVSGGGWGASGDYPAWKASAPLLFRDMDKRWQQLTGARDEVREARRMAAEAGTADDREAGIRRIKLSEELLRRAEDEVRLYRDYIRQRGFDPGELPPELAHLDSSTAAADGDR